MNALPYVSTRCDLKSLDNNNASRMVFYLDDNYYSSNHGPAAFTVCCKINHKKQRAVKLQTHHLPDFVHLPVPLNGIVDAPRALTSLLGQLRSLNLPLEVHKLYLRIADRVVTTMLGKIFLSAMCLCMCSV